MFLRTIYPKTGSHFSDCALTALELQYAVGIHETTSIWPPGCGPLPPKPSRRGRPATKLCRDADHQPLPARDLALELDKDAWQNVTWREGTNAPLTSRFAAVRVRPAHRDHKLEEPRPLEWLLIEWPENEDGPSKFWLSTLPAETSLESLVDYAKLRWRIERDYQELKQEIGLGHYEGRGWRGFHHHASMAIAAYGFLICEAQRIPPSGPGTIIVKRPPQCQNAALPEGYRPRGAPAPTGAPRAHIHRHSQTTPHRPPGIQP